MAKKVVIVGAVAVGPKVACRLRRLDPEAEITVVDRDSLISYGGCGIPYYVSGDVNDLEDLYSTTFHAVRDAEFFATGKGVTVHTETEAVAIDRRQKLVEVKDLKTGEKRSLPYDYLVLATGATPFRLPIAGNDLPRVFTIAGLHQAERIKTLMQTGKVGRAVVVGAGAIGVEFAEALADLWGIETTLIELDSRVLPMALGNNIATIAVEHLREKGVDVRLSESVESIEKDPDSDIHYVVTSTGRIGCDLVVLAAGVRANSSLAADAGLSIGGSGGIVVDARMRTSDRFIYAGGDCVEVRNLVSGGGSLMPLGSLANRQGRVIATNIDGGSARFDGTVGTFCIKVFDLGICTAGLTMIQARKAGFDPVCSIVSQVDHAHFYPDAEMIYMVLIADRKSRRILGVQAAGNRGEAVKARVDAIAVRLADGVDVDDVCCLETGYAPPFSSAMDVVNNAGNCLENILRGASRPVSPVDFLDEFGKGEATVLDVRGPREAEYGIAKYGKRWLHIPLGELRKRYEELPDDVHLYILCDTGPRSYESQVLLDAVGKSNTSAILGGYAMIRKMIPDFL